MSNVIFVALLLLLTTITATIFYSIKGKWIRKIAFLITLFAFSSAIFFSFESYKGWPTTEELASGQVAWVEIVKPEAIYVWIYEDAKIQVNLFEKYLNYVPPFRLVPRAYVIPYSDERAKQFTEALEKMEDGYLARVDKDSTQKIVDGEIVVDSQQVLRIISPDKILKKESIE